MVGIFPNRQAVTRLLGALLVEQNDEWIVGKLYMGAETRVFGSRVRRKTLG